MIDTHLDSTATTVEAPPTKWRNVYFLATGGTTLGGVNATEQDCIEASRRLFANIPRLSETYGQCMMSDRKIVNYADFRSVIALPWTGDE